MKTQRYEKCELIYLQDKAIYKYNDGSYQYENYPELFKSVIDCLKWGKAMDKAKADRADALERIKKLECDSTILPVDLAIASN
jgi:hypothetical protein